MHMLAASIGLSIHLAAATAAGNDGINLAANPGFEELGPDGRPTAWRMAPGYSIDTNAPHSGSACLRYDAANTNRYLLCSAPIRLQPGERYEIEARVRTSNVTGDDSGATVCLEWSDADGRFLGGCYPNGIKGTSAGWQTVRGISGTMPSNAARTSVHCYLRRGMIGTAWWDDVIVRRWYPPLLNAMTTDHYRHRLTGGVVRVHAGIELEAHRITPADPNPLLRVHGADGAPLTTAAPVRVESDSVTFAVDSSAWPEGPLLLEITARGVGGTEAARRLEAARTGPPQIRKAFIDGRRRLVADGRPFFPLGMYWGAVKADELAIYAKSPFNCLMPYADIGRAGLDLAHSNGMKVIYSVKDLYEGHRRLASRDAADAAVRATVAALRDHPAIIAWYINDEFPLWRLEELSARQRLMEELDPGRPTWSVLYQVGDLRGYLPTCDVIGADPYPIPWRPTRMALDWTRAAVHATFGVRPVWMVPQVFNWASYKKTPEERARQRAPTLAEMRTMAWSCIAAGADGLIFYSWFDLWRMDQLLNDGGRADTHDPFEDRWKDVAAMAAEIREFIPLLLSDEPPPALSIEAPDVIAGRTFRHGGRSYLLCVNADDARSDDIRIKVDGAERIERAILGAGPPPGPWDGRLHLPPLSVCVLELSP